MILKTELGGGDGPERAAASSCESLARLLAALIIIIIRERNTASKLQLHCLDHTQYLIEGPHLDTHI